MRDVPDYLRCAFDESEGHGTWGTISRRPATPGTWSERRARLTLTLVPVLPRRNWAARSPVQPSSTTLPSILSTCPAGDGRTLKQCHGVLVGVSSQGVKALIDAFVPDACMGAARMQEHGTPLEISRTLNADLWGDDHLPPLHASHSLSKSSRHGLRAPLPTNQQI